MDILQTRAADFEGPLEPTIDVTVDTAAKDIQSKGCSMQLIQLLMISCAASPALNEVLLRQEMEEEGAQTEALGNEEGTRASTDKYTGRCI